MGNRQHGVELYRPNATYEPNEVVSGTVRNLFKDSTVLLLIGKVQFKKPKRKRIEYRQIVFFSSAFPLTSSRVASQEFHIQLSEQLPPSFNKSDVYPNISYSLNLIGQQQPNSRLYVSLPIRVCPRVRIDRPLLLNSLQFGPVDNQTYGAKLHVKVNQSVFEFGDVIVVFYELQNPSEVLVEKIEVSLGAYYVVESNVHQENVTKSTDIQSLDSSRQKLFQRKALLNVPEKIYWPPTCSHRHDQGGESSVFNLAIDYKIQFKIHLGNPVNLWQVDVPVVLCSEVIRRAELDTENNLRTFGNTMHPDSEATDFENLFI